MRDHCLKTLQQIWPLMNASFVTHSKDYYGCCTRSILYQPIYPSFVVGSRRAMDACLHDNRHKAPLKQTYKSSAFMFAW